MSESTGSCTSSDDNHQDNIDDVKDDGDDDDSDDVDSDDSRRLLPPMSGQNITVRASCSDILQQNRYAIHY